MARVNITFSTEELANEIWLPVVGYEGYYCVSSLGRVRSELSRGRGKAGKILTLGFDRGRDYLQIGLSREGKQKHFKVHVLVAAAFIGERPAKMDINHTDGVKTNNRRENLEYVTRSENVLHAFRMGLIIPATGDRHSSRTHPERMPRGERHGTKTRPDRIARGDRNGKYTKPEKTPRGESHYKTRIKEAEISQMIALRESGKTQCQIAAIVGLSQPHVSKILINRGKGGRLQNP
jgi:hypothetical protein